MLCISFVDLLPASMEAVGFWRANVWFYTGVGFFAIIVYFIPEPAAAEAAIAASEKASSGGKSSLEERKHRKEVLMSGIITAIGAPCQLIEAEPQGHCEVASCFVGSLHAVRMQRTPTLISRVTNAESRCRIVLGVMSGCSRCAKAWTSCKA